MTSLAKTPLWERHQAAGARMVPFAGYSMPVQYEGLMDEHHAVRRAAGIFDVSHMAEVELRGPDAAALADHLTPSRLSTLEPGRVVYSCLTTERGTFVDDILAYRLEAERFLFVVNATNRAKDVAWIEDHATRFNATVEDVSDRTALIAFQGPLARGIVASLASGFDAKSVKYYHVAQGLVAGRRVLASRTGYTGEQGFEIFCEPEDAPHLWDALLDAGRADGVQPAGLGARDSLRLEAALPLYGNDIDDTTTVLEAALEFVIDWEKRGFIGREALDAQRARGPSRRRVGFEVVDRGIARHGHGVFVRDEHVGHVSSGTFSPTLEKAIGMAYVPASMAAAGTEFEIDVRGKRLRAITIPMPFYKRPKST
ncbi:MAG: glycine cleavage system aminomethyltransferase GcvT [Acidobacteria bacterium]|nr:glycine cleavage system aminomethyltransferase GcvT [Acidobacteriota bacterium]